MTSFGRDFALARAAALLNEEDFDRVPHLEVCAGQQLRKWGMSTTPAGSILQEQQAHQEMGLDMAWSSGPLAQKVERLQKAYKTIVGKGIPAGSYARSLLQVACSQVAREVQASMQDLPNPHEGALVSLVNMLAERMAIQDVHVGSELEDLKPTAGHKVKGLHSGGLPIRSMKGRTFSNPQLCHGSWTNQWRAQVSMRQHGPLLRCHRC